MAKVSTVESVADLVKRGKAVFEENFAYQPDKAACGPGRVNLIGEHTDYNDGFVFPMV